MTLGSRPAPAAPTGRLNRQPEVHGQREPPSYRSRVRRPGLNVKGPAGALSPSVGWTAATSSSVRSISSSVHRCGCCPRAGRHPAVGVQLPGSWCRPSKQRSSVSCELSAEGPPGPRPAPATRRDGRGYGASGRRSRCRSSSSSPNCEAVVYARVFEETPDDGDDVDRLRDARDHRAVRQQIPRTLMSDRNAGL